MESQTKTETAQQQLEGLKASWPRWTPEPLVSYLAHIEFGLPIRAIGRARACHASTISRQVSRWEHLRDDPLIDEALSGLVKPCTGRAGCNSPRASDKDTPIMTMVMNKAAALPDDDTFQSEARRVLRRLSEPGAVLALAGEMEKGVVVRETASETTTRTAIVERSLAQALALKEWIQCASEGRVARYRITNAGRAALNRLLAEAENRAGGFAEAPAGFEPQAGFAAEGAKRARYCGGESPLMLLARRREKDGELFLPPELVAAGERLREDFELAQIGLGEKPDWDGLIAGETTTTKSADKPLSSEAAMARAGAALAELGVGLGDVALRCCCQLEGVETAERALGWSARSGKIVLRIALARLAGHYTKIGSSQMIG
ncbi:helix-turn-helix domain-containing protein [Lentibacter algarum]|nr:DUF6456 domain-containing protein [Lentibacter algarum]MBU2982288.1 helix-turn-helix domain-containing protein [Lentibacter algarum]